MLNQNGDGSSNSLKDQKLCFACQASSKISQFVEVDTDPNEIMELDLWRYCQYDHGIGWGTFGNTPTAVTYVASLWGGSIGGIVV